MEKYWLIFFEDTERETLTFSDEQAARKAYAGFLVSWNCMLFEQVTDESGKELRAGVVPVGVVAELLSAAKEGCQRWNVDEHTCTECGVRVWRRSDKIEHRMNCLIRRAEEAVAAAKKESE